MNKIHITDVILRDSHQSLIATRMRTEDMLPICDRLDKMGYWSLEVWGGATFDACVRFLKEEGMRGYLVGALEAHHVLEALKSSNLAVVLEVSAPFNHPGRDIGFDVDGI